MYSPTLDSVHHSIQRDEEIILESPKPKRVFRKGKKTNEYETQSGKAPKEIASSISKDNIIEKRMRKANLMEEKFEIDDNTYFALLSNIQGDDDMPNTYKQAV